MAAVPDASHAASASVPVSAPQAAAPQRVTTPEAVYHAIAYATLPRESTADRFSARLTAVKKFISNNGGDAIYASYIQQYGAPTNIRLTSVAETTGLKTRSLGHYYLHPPLLSGADVVAGPCTSFATSKGPTQKAQCALAEWDAYLLTHDSSYRDQFLTWAQYFVRQSSNGKIRWTAVTVPAMGITRTPWISALTQSQVISVLLRAYQSTGQQKYLDTAKQAYLWLTIPLSQGGLKSKGPNAKGVWLEEYPNPSQPSHVFNGNIWALFGVWDYYRVTGDASALQLFQADVATIKSNITVYDLGYWNVYSSLNRVDAVNGGYMQFIIQQMYVMYAITEDPFFKSLGRTWGADQATDALFVHNMARAYLQTPSASE